MVLWVLLLIDIVGLCLLRTIAAHYVGPNKHFDSGILRLHMSHYSAFRIAFEIACRVPLARRDRDDLSGAYRVCKIVDYMFTCPF